MATPPKVILGSVMFAKMSEAVIAKTDGETQKDLGARRFFNN